VVTVVVAPGAAALVRERPDLLIVDVSPPEEFALGHLEGAVNIPRSQLWVRMQDLPPDFGVPILVCDARGQRSRSAALLLRDEGYYRVHELKGGVAAWVEAGYGLRSGF
jgi:rhodanese-related sulfurtransferase